MHNPNFKKNKRILVLLLITITISFLYFDQFLWNSNNTINGKALSIESEIIKELKTSSYPQAFENSGEDIDVILHQSYVNNSFDTIVKTSEVNENNFFVPCPTDTSFNTSFTKFEVEDIYAPNKSLIVEDDSSGQDTLDENYYTSFRVPTDCYLTNLSIELLSPVSADIFYFDIFGALNHTDGNPKFDTSKDLTGLGPRLGQHTNDSSTPVWFTLTGLDQFLDVSETHDNYFFIKVSSENAQGMWRYESFLDGDETYSYKNSQSTHLTIIDYTLKVGLRPVENNIANASDINLKISNTNVTDITDGQGYWESTEVNSSATGKLEYNVTADWWDVTCNISQVQINYTSTDLKAGSNFDVSASGQDVAWNVTKNGGLNYFGIDFNNFRINFTIPATWHDSSIKVFNGSDEWSINKRLLGDGYREVEVPNAINGTFWFLNATSDNLIGSIDTYVEGVAINDIANYTDIVQFNTTFTEIIKKGSLNLSIYSPSPNYLNHTSIVNISILNPNIEFNVSDWDLSLNVTEYGVFITYLAWNNGTAAGFLMGNLTILGETELKFINLPPLIFDAGDIFNITAFFNDTGYIGTPPKNISDGMISYSINSNNYRTDNITILGDGLYNITIDCNDLEFNSNGPNSITINASKQYYNNQSETIDITILGETTLTVIYPSDGATFDSSNTFNITVKYNNSIRSEIISTPNINYSLDGGSSYRYDNIASIGDNKYNITVNCYDTDFGNYGLENIIVNASKSYYHNQSESFSITITGDTALALTKWPDKSFYYSDENFIITANFNDTSRNQGIDGATIDVDVDGTTYISPSLVYVGNGNYNITIDCSDAIFSNYGAFNVRINASKLNYYTKSDSSLDPIIIGNTSLIILSPSDDSIYTTAQIFNIIIQYEDVVQSIGIPGATIEYSLNEGSSFIPDNVTYEGSGRYNITVYANHPDFNKTGFFDLIINASKQNYNNLSVSLTIHRQITTTITPNNIFDLGSVIRGLNVSYTFNYSDTDGNPIKQASENRISDSYGFIAFLENYGNGTYTMHFNTSLVDVSSSPFTYIFNISSIGNETQVISLTIDVTIIETRIENLLYSALIARNSGLNQTVKFYFNDTTNNKPVPDVLTSDVIVRNNDTGAIWDRGDFNWELSNGTGKGNYILNISLNGLNSGLYTLELDVSNSPNYESSIRYLQFYLRGNFTQINIISVADVGGEGVLVGIGNNYSSFIGLNLYLDFNISDNEFFNNLVTGEANSYTLTYADILNSSNSGFLAESLSFDANTDTFKGIIYTSSLTRLSTYTLNLTVENTNYESTYYTFNLTIKAKYLVRLNVTNPGIVDAGDSFIIVVKAEYFNGTEWLPIEGTNIIHLTSYYNGIVSPEIETKSTNSTGEVFYEIILRGDVTTANFTIQLDEEYYHLGDLSTISDIEVIPLPGGFAFEDLIPYLIIIGAAVVLIGGSIGVYRGVVVPKKREKSRILKEVKTIFDDAINLEHILVLYKGTGTCVYFKSFGSEEIDPELISGFISAICSFGKDLVCQEELNEISYGDKMLLLSDGEYIRVALVLSKKPSIILRKNLMEFIDEFEKSYINELPNWRGQLNIFRNSGVLIDEILNTSIILPHQISYEFSNVKALKNTHSRDVLKVANKLMKVSERKFFFIATLLKEATEKTNKGTAEIFMGIKELRDKKMMLPIEISAIEVQPISQQEMALINQKVASLVNLNQEERQKIVDDLAQMGPAEREAYFVSLGEQEIVSAPIEEKPGAAVIDSIKVAKKEIKNLKKIAKTAKKEKDYEKTINILQNAAKLAANWELIGESEEFEEFIRLTKIEDLKIKMITLEKEAKLAAKDEKFNEAAQKYKMSSKIASEIFKLGGTEMTKEVKRLSNKSKEYEKLI